MPIAVVAGCDAVEHESSRPRAAQLRRAEQVPRPTSCRLTRIAKMLAQSSPVEAHERSWRCAGVDRVDDDRAARVGEVGQQQQPCRPTFDQLDAVA